MRLVPLLICALWGLMLSLHLVPWLIHFWLAHPAGDGKLTGARRQLHHIHSQPIPRVGGLAIATCFAVCGLLAYFLLPRDYVLEVPRPWLIAMPLAMFGLGFVDDLHPLGAKKKLLGQILIASATWALGLRLETASSPFSNIHFELGLWSLPLTVLWLVATTNLINLVDGIDGLAAGISLMLFGLLAWSSFTSGLGFATAIAAGMAGCLLGFLGYNFPPARIYLGDGGAYFLGFTIGLFSLVNSQKGAVAAALIAPMFALALPVIDTTLSILRRALNGLPVFRPDRKHLHHRLLESGLSRRDALLVLYGVSLVFLVLAFGVAWSEGRWAPTLFGLLCVVLFIAARSFGFSRAWLSVGSMVRSWTGRRGIVLQARQACRWLERRAESETDPEGLWADLALIVSRLDCTGVVLETEGARRAWSLDLPAPGNDADSKVDLNFDSPALHSLQLECSPAAHSPRALELIADVLAEGWLKAVVRWERRNKSPFRLGPGAASAAQGSPGLPQPQ